MRPPTIRNRITVLAACSLFLAACETYKADGSPAAADQSANAAVDTKAAEPAPNTAAPIPAKPAAAKAAPAKAGAGPACEKVIDHVIEVMLADSNIPEDRRAQMKAAIPQQKPAMIQQCNQAPWPAPLRDCLLEAKTAADFQGCQKHAPPRP